MDWIGNRVQPRCTAWVEMVEVQAASEKPEGPWMDHTPWWEEVKRCVESDHVPNRSEGWNHPIASSYSSRGCTFSHCVLFHSNICGIHHCAQPVASIAGPARANSRLSALGGRHIAPLFTDSTPLEFTTVRSNVRVHIYARGVWSQMIKCL